MPLKAFAYLLTALMIVSFLPQHVFADISHLQGLKQEHIADNIALQFYPESKDTELIAKYFGPDRKLTAEQLLSVKKILLAQTLFANAAREIKLLETKNVSIAPDENEDLILSSLYHQHLLEKYEPSESELRQFYEENIVSLVANVENSTVAPFETTKDVLRQSLIQLRVDNHYLAMLVGAESAINALAVGQGMDHSMHMAGMRSMVGRSPAERTAYMTSHFEAGALIYNAGNTEAAVGHLSHPTSDMHQEEWQGLDAYGFDQSLFVHIPHMIKMGKMSKEEVNVMIDTARTNLHQVAKEAGTEPDEIIRFILSIAAEDYGKAVVDQTIQDEKRYQDVGGYLAVVNYWKDELSWFKRRKVSSSIQELIDLYQLKNTATVTTTDDFKNAIAHIQESI